MVAGNATLYEACTFVYVREKLNVVILATPWLPYDAIIIKRKISIVY